MTAGREFEILRGRARSDRASRSFRSVLAGVNAELPAAKDPHDAPTSGEGYLRHP